MAIGFPLANDILLADFHAISHTRATTGEIRFYKDDDPPGLDGSGGTLVGAGHSAETVSFNGATWTVTGMTATNAALMVGNANASAQVTFTHWAIFNAAGELMFRGALAGLIVVPSGAPYQIAAGTIDFTIGGAFTAVHGNDWLDHILTGATAPDVTATQEIELVSTAPTDAAAGTALAGTGYIDLTVDSDSDHWTVTNNEVENAVDFEYGAAASDWTDPHGHNIYDANGKRRYFLNYESAQPLIETNEALWRAGDLAMSID